MSNNNELGAQVMSKWEDDWDEEDYENLAELEFDEVEEESSASTSKVYTLMDMERHGEAAAAAIDEMLRSDPDTPTHVLMEEMRKHVLPLCSYRPTDEEINAIRRADIMHTLRGDKESDDPEEEDTELFPDSTV